MIRNVEIYYYWTTYRSGRLDPDYHGGEEGDVRSIPVDKKIILYIRDRNHENKNHKWNYKNIVNQLKTQLLTKLKKL